jgi:UDP-glucose 4-epimerase
MKVLVTGGAGYIGSVTAELLIAKGARVVVLDNLSTGHRDAVPAAADFVPADLADQQLVVEVVKCHRPDAIMHFAARSLVGESMQDPLRYLGENVINGLNLMGAAVDGNVRRFVLSSTANLFGDPQAIPINEDEPIAPGSPYGESKHLLERALHWLDRLGHLRFAALRYFNAAGATEQRGEDHRPETHLIPVTLQVALGQRDKLTIFGDDYPTEDGTCVRDYVHVLDLADAHVRALDMLSARSRVYNLGNGRGFSVQQVVKAAREVTGHAIPVDIGPRRPGDPAALVASSDRICRELGWSPQHSDLRGILASAWQWHCAHPQGYHS